MNFKSFFTALLLILSFSLWAGVGSKSALIVIDMQPYFVERGGNNKDLENTKKVASILAEQERMILQARAANMPVIFIEYEYAGYDFGATNERLSSAAEGYKQATVVKKSSDGMFDDAKSKAKLNKLLAEKGINHLYITGANGGACVKDSIQGALENNYSVTSVSQGVADFNYKEFIYPYKGHYHFNPTCPTCSFKEVDGIVDFVAGTERVDQNVNDEDRGVSKEIPSSGSSRPAPEADVKEQ